MIFLIFIFSQKVVTPCQVSLPTLPIVGGVPRLGRREVFAYDAEMVACISPRMWDAEMVVPLLAYVNCVDPGCRSRLPTQDAAQLPSRCFPLFFHAGRCWLGFIRSFALSACLWASRGCGRFNVAGYAYVTACEW